MIKYILIGLLLVVSLAGQTAVVDKMVSRNGDLLIRVSNIENYTVQCQIWNDTYYVEFNLGPMRTSRWYIEPYGNYTVECE